MILNQNLSRKKLTIFVLLTIVAIIPLTVFIAQKQQEVRQRAAGEQAVLSFRKPDDNTILTTFNVVEGKQTTLNLYLDTPININGYDITLVFNSPGGDPNLLTLDSVVDGVDASKFNTVLFNHIIDRTNNSIHVGKVNTDSSRIINGSLQLLTIHSTVNSLGTSTVSIIKADITSASNTTFLTTNIPLIFNYTVTETISPSITSTTTLTNSPTLTPIPSATNIPTPTPTSTPIPTNTPVPGAVNLALDLYLQGIGSAGGENPGLPEYRLAGPRTLQRKVIVEVYDGSNRNRKIGNDKEGFVNYDSSSMTFKGNISLGVLTPGSYTFKVKSDKYLKKLIPGLYSVTANQTTPILTPQVKLIVGDIIGNNSIDIEDWNAYLACVNQPVMGNCVNTDLNDDGQNDIQNEIQSLRDQRLLRQSFMVHEGD